jgi:hypothetical protein
MNLEKRKLFPSVIGQNIVFVWLMDEYGMPSQYICSHLAIHKYLSPWHILCKILL